MVKAALAIALYVALVVVAIALLVRLLAGRIPGVTITSWWRSIPHNDDVGGLPGSLHILGWAVDIVPVTPEIEEQARKMFPVVVNEGNHLHAAIFKA